MQLISKHLFKLSIFLCVFLSSGSFAANRSETISLNKKTEQIDQELDNVIEKYGYTKDDLEAWRKEHSFDANNYNHEELEELFEDLFTNETDKVILGILALLDVGIDPNTKTRDGNTALMYAAAGGHVELVKTLLEAGANPDQADNYGLTALMGAAANGHREIVETLLKAGANPDQANHHGWTALMYAALCGHVEVVETLLKAGANPDQASDSGGTALMGAVLGGHIEVVETLLKAGANPDQTDANGETAMNIAASCGHDNVVKLLKTQEQKAKADA